jgi:MFS family permease
MFYYFQNNFDKYLSNFRGLSSLCWAAVIMTFLQCVAAGMCYFISLYFINDLHIGISTVGIMLSCYGGGRIIGGVLSGKLCDLYSPLKILIYSSIVQSVSFALLAMVANPALLIFIMLVMGISSYSFRTANDVWMLNNCGNDEKMRIKALNLTRVGMNLGLGVSGVIIGLLADNGFKSIFYIFSAVLLFSAFYVAMQAGKIATKNDVVEDVEKVVSANVKILFIVLFSLFCVSLMIAQLGSTYPLYLVESFPNLGMKAVSILYLLDTFLIVFVQAPLTNSLGSCNKMLVMGLGAFMMGAGMLILSLSHVFVMAILSCVIWTTGEMLFVPMSQLLCYENGGAKQQGQVMGIYQSVYAVGAVLGPAGGGFIYHQSGGNMVWYGCMLLGSISLFLSMLYMKSQVISPGFYADAATQEG